MTHGIMVAPFVGAWIETQVVHLSVPPSNVAPFVGAWIETMRWITKNPSWEQSLPSWERGLKLAKVFDKSFSDCRSLRGSVD